MIFDRRAFLYTLTLPFLRFPPSRSCDSDLHKAERFLRLFQTYKDRHSRYRLRLTDRAGQKLHDMTRLTFIDIRGGTNLVFGFEEKMTRRMGVELVTFIDDEGYEFNKIFNCIPVSAGDTLIFSYGVVFNVGGQA